METKEGVLKRAFCGAPCMFGEKYLAPYAGLEDGRARTSPPKRLLSD